VQAVFLKWQDFPKENGPKTAISKVHWSPIQKRFLFPKKQEAFHKGSP
jgi:hypothetical protein